MINSAKRKAISLLRLSYKHFLKFMGVKKDKTARNLFRLFQTAAYAFIAISAAAIFFTILIPLLGGKIELGVIGDFFGGILNPTLTFITFMGLLVTIVLQNKELKEARKEAKRSADALSEQSNTMLKQSYDQNFFSMLSLHQEIINSIDTLDTKTREVYRGRIALSYMYESFKKSKQTNAFRDEDRLDLMKKYTNDDFMYLWNKQCEKLHYYFRFLTNILSYIERSPLPCDYYIDTIKSQLSNSELCLIFYFGLSIQGNELYQKVTKYGLLENLPKQSLLAEAHRVLYDKSAYS